MKEKEILNDLTAENNIIADRRKKLIDLRKNGTAYPNNFFQKNRASLLQQLYADKKREFFETALMEVSIAGRIMLKRLQGKTSFFTLQDSTDRIQLYVNDDSLGLDGHAKAKQFDIGDHVYVEGDLFKTKRGELSVRCKKISILAKSIRPLPDKFHGLQDIETKVRQRHLDLIANADTRKTFEMRSKLLSKLREFMDRSKFLEVETPMLHPIPGGATARPFVTHHNSLDQEMFLRIAPELYLKRLIVGGFERVFEINRSFRNEGISTRHNPEFTMMEFYAAYTDYKWLMSFVESMLEKIAISVLGTSKIFVQGTEIDLKKNFNKLTIYEALSRVLDDSEKDSLKSVESVKKLLKKYSGKDKKKLFYSDNLAILQYKLFESIAEDSLIEPTFIINYPVEVSPLARVSDDNPEITERFELYIGGKEIANGFSELNDPEDQAQRFLSQVEAKTAGDHEAMHFDEDYVRTLETGMPPTSGCGIGIDRLMMLLSNKQSIREVIFFPALRHLS
jgi:lysyl-tRNA synthetase class 2